MFNVIRTRRDTFVVVEGPQVSSTGVVGTYPTLAAAVWEAGRRGEDVRKTRNYLLVGAAVWAAVLVYQIIGALA